MEQKWTWVYLLAGTVTFISVFIQITLRIRPFQRILEKQAGRTDRIIVILLFGGFSILGTYMGIPLPSGAIGNVRDLGPIIVGLVGGPLLGLGAGLIGGIHRYFLGGFTRISCALATILIGLMSGFAHKLNRGELPKLGWAALFTVLVECFHMALTLLMARPFDEALLVVKTVTLPMMLANSIGVAISILFISGNRKA
jgi:sigma-B regulation protein RsbU (phosphoserine phosphatase)